MCVCCHIFLNQLSVDRNLSSFYILAITNSAAMNPGVHVLFKLLFPFFPDIYPGV